MRVEFHPIVCSRMVVNFPRNIESDVVGFKLNREILFIPIFEENQSSCPLLLKA